jgi:hypothetical protein
MGERKKNEKRAFGAFAPGLARLRPLVVPSARTGKDLLILAERLFSIYCRRNGTYTYTLPKNKSISLPSAAANPSLKIHLASSSLSCRPVPPASRSLFTPPPGLTLAK